jgi:hypothetical protein
MNTNIATFNHSIAVNNDASLERIYPLHPGHQTVKQPPIAFGNPTAEIGDIVSFSSTLDCKYRRSLLVRLFFSVVYGAIVSSGAHYLLSRLLETNGVGILFAAAIAGVAVFLLGMRATTIHVSTYICTEGIARYTCHSGDTSNLASSKVLRFQDAARLNTTTTKVLTNNTYSHTEYSFSWYSNDGELMACFKGSGRDKDGNEAWLLSEKPFLISAERAWNKYASEQLLNRLEEHGYAQFWVSNPSMSIRVGRNWIEFEQNGKRERWDRVDVGGVALKNGIFLIWHKLFKVHRGIEEGVLELPYESIGNAKLFLAMVQRNPNVSL